MFLLKNVSFAYEKKKILNNISFSIDHGEFVSIFGRNGSGKSTLAKLLAALVFPQEGNIFVNGTNTQESEKIFDIRRKVGFTFQNPDDQIIAKIVEDEVAFGPENLGIPNPNLCELVNDSLECVGLACQRKKDVNKLSGGDKQKTIFAGSLALGVECIILDEITSMLDTQSRSEVLSQIIRLQKEKKMTIIMLTHHIDEIVLANRVLVLEKGKLIADGKPKEMKKKFFDAYEEMKPKFVKKKTLAS
jgi:energy-coupling factor transport system ATP-binding protein